MGEVASHRGRKFTQTGLTYREPSIKSDRNTLRVFNKSGILKWIKALLKKIADYKCYLISACLCEPASVSVERASCRAPCREKRAARHSNWLFELQREDNRTYNQQESGRGRQQQQREEELQEDT